MHSVVVIVIALVAALVAAQVQRSTTPAPVNPDSWVYNAFVDSTTTQGRSLAREGWEAFASCDAAALRAKGQQASPINFQQVSVDLGLKPLILRWPSFSNFSLVATANKSLKCVVDPSVTPTMYDPNTASGYALTSVEFFSPSQHAIGGGKFDAEIILWHQRQDIDQLSTRASSNSATNVTTATTATTSSTARTPSGATTMMAVSILLKRGDVYNSNAILERFFLDYRDYTLAATPRTVPDRATYDALLANLTKDVLHSQYVEISELIPPSRNYYTYVGTAPRPPCEADVRYYVLEQPVYAAGIQIDFIRAVTGSGVFLDRQGATPEVNSATAYRGNVRTLQTPVTQQRSNSGAPLTTTTATSSSNAKDTPRRYVDFAGNAFAGLDDPQAQSLNQDVGRMALAAVILGPVALAIALLAARLASM